MSKFNIFLIISLVLVAYLNIKYEIFTKPRWDDTCTYLTDSGTYIDVSDAHRTTQSVTFTYEGRKVRLVEGNYSMECVINR